MGQTKKNNYEYENEIFTIVSFRENFSFFYRPYFSSLKEGYTSRKEPDLLKI